MNVEWHDVTDGDPKVGCSVANAFAAADPGLSEACGHRAAEPEFKDGRWIVHCPACDARWAASVTVVQYSFTKMEALRCRPPHHDFWSGGRRARAGDTIDYQARVVLAKRLHLPLSETQREVAAKVAGNSNGGWFCATCGDCPANNLQADCHANGKPAHLIAWLAFDTNTIEEP